MAITLVKATFLGRNVGGGVIARMRDALALAEDALKAEHAAKAPQIPWLDWCGVHDIGGWRANGGPHTKGIAVDLDYTMNPYIATRTGPRLGGEAQGAKLTKQRQMAIDACDRAVAMHTGHAKADLAARRKGESTAAVWDRFCETHDALVKYFAPYFRHDGKLVSRVPVPDLSTATTEDFQPLMVSGELLMAPHDVPIQVLIDYEAVRIPMVVGSPSSAPRVTRNPARGFMTIPRHVAIALCDVAHMRWGMCDFGPESSGDGMHFDLSP